ncbi:MAG: SDR family oxidoreductase [Gammaproteobacteria bacterium]
MNNQFKNKSVIVTGGTKGIGKGIAESYLAEGSKVFVLSRNPIKKQIIKKGNKAVFIKCDIRDNVSIENAINEILTYTKNIDILINNAGGSPLINAIEGSINFHKSVIDFNLTAQLQMSVLIAKRMLKQKTVSSIINISSVTANRPTPGSAAYGAAKGGLVNLTQTLAIEWAPKIRVNAIITGYIETENSLIHYGNKTQMKKVAKTIPLKRMGTPSDIAHACLFLSSNNASWISGAALEVHGGGENPAYLNALK